MTVNKYTLIKTALLSLLMVSCSSEKDMSNAVAVSDDDAVVAVSDKSGNSVSQDSNLIRTDFFEYPETGVEVGQGWDSINERPTMDSCIVFREVEEQGHDVQTIYHDVRNRYHLNEILKLSATARAKFSKVKASASAKFKKEIDFDLNSRNLLVQVDVDMGDSYAAPQKYDANGSKGIDTSIRLKPEYVEMLSSEKASDKQKFLKSCGDSFVTKIERGGELFVNYEMNHESRAEDREFSLELKASGFGSSGSFNLDKLNKAEFEKEIVDFEVLQRGGPRLPVPIDLDSIFSSIQSFVIGYDGILESSGTDSGFIPRPYSLITNSYEILPNVIETNLPSAAKMDDLIALSNLYDDLIGSYSNRTINQLGIQSEDLSLYNTERLRLKEGCQGSDCKDEARSYMVLRSPSYLLAAEEAQIQTEKIILGLTQANAIELEKFRHRIYAQFMQIGLMQHLTMRSDEPDAYFKAKLDQVPVNPIVYWNLYIDSDNEPSKRQFFGPLDIINGHNGGPFEFGFAKKLNTNACGKQPEYYVDNTLVGPDHTFSKAHWRLGGNKSGTYDGVHLPFYSLSKIFEEALKNNVSIKALKWDEIRTRVYGVQPYNQVIEIPVEGGDKIEITIELDAKNVQEIALLPQELRDVECWYSMSKNTWSHQNVYNIIFELETIQLLLEKALAECFEPNSIKTGICDSGKAVQSLSTRGKSQVNSFKKDNNFDLITDNLMDDDYLQYYLLANQPKGKGDISGSKEPIGIDLKREKLFDEIINHYKKGSLTVDNLTPILSELYYRYVASLPLETNVISNGSGALNAIAQIENIEATRSDIISNEIIPNLYFQNSYFCDISRTRKLCMPMHELESIASDYKFRLPISYYDMYEKRKHCRKRRTRKYGVVGRRKKSCWYETYHSDRIFTLNMMNKGFNHE